MNTWFDLKTIDFLGRQCTILCQNENGPCPLLAIANVLILQNKIHFHPERCRVMLDELVEVVANSIIEKGLTTSHSSEDKKGSEQQQLDSALNVIPNMARGLDLNIFFSDVASFEFTEEISVFDALDIPLLHGWVLDPQDDASFSVINSNCSYNHLMYKLVEYRSIQERINSPKPSQSASEPPIVDLTVRVVSGQEGDNTLQNLSSTPVICDNSWVSIDKTDGKLEISDALPQANITAKHSKLSTASGDEKHAFIDHENNVCDDVVNVVSHHQNSGVKTAPIAKERSVPAVNPLTLSQDDIELCRQGRIIESFLNSTASQLTYIGLASLHQKLRERQLAVFFRNNHFCSLFRYQDNLYLLVTDLGYQNESGVVWERLDAIDGDTDFVNSNFARSSSRTYHQSGSASSHSTGHGNSSDWIGTVALPRQSDSDRDYSGGGADVDGGAMLAYRLQMEENELAMERSRSSGGWGDHTGTVAGASSAHILQHRAIAQANRRMSGGNSTDTRNQRRIPNRPTPDTSSNSPCLIC